MNTGLSKRRACCQALSAGTSREIWCPQTAPLRLESTPAAPLWPALHSLRQHPCSLRRLLPPCPSWGEHEADYAKDVNVPGVDAEVKRGKNGRDSDGRGNNGDQPSTSGMPGGQSGLNGRRVSLTGTDSYVSENNNGSISNGSVPGTATAEDAWGDWDSSEDEWGDREARLRDSITSKNSKRALPRLANVSCDWFCGDACTGLQKAGLLFDRASCRHMHKCTNNFYLSATCIICSSISLLTRTGSGRMAEL